MALLAAGCDRGTRPVTTTWEAVLTSPTRALSGTVAVISQSDRIRANISIQGAQAGAEHAWRLRTGTCDDPGSVVGGRALYPTLQVGDGGSASADALIAGMLEPDGTYHAAALATAADDAPVAACGALRRQ